MPAPDPRHRARSLPVGRPRTAGRAHAGSLRRHAGQPAASRSGFTLLEIVVVLVLLGLVIGVTAPSLLRPEGHPVSEMQSLIDAARRTAVGRAAAVSLRVEPDGRWVLTGGGETGSGHLRAGSGEGSGRPPAGSTESTPPLRAGTVEWNAAATLRIRISPLGACTLERGEGDAPPFVIDPIRCRLAVRSQPRPS